jgi:hypothetical protein
MRRATALLLLVAGVVAGALLVGCGSGSSTSTPSPGEGSPPGPSPIAQEQNPPGDIPDNQVFVSYHSAAGGYSLDVPEGWARKESGPSVSFADKFNSIGVDISSSSTAPTVDSAAANDLPQLERQVDAFEKVAVNAVDLPAGKGVLIRYRANSAADPVTGKGVRLETDRYELFKDGKVAVLSLSAPAGADNVDVWNQISKSLKWG